MFGLKYKIGNLIMRFVAKKMLNGDDEKRNPGGIGDVKRYKRWDGEEIISIDLDQDKTYKDRRRRIK